MFNNMFFLVVALTQLVPMLKVGSLAGYFGPLAFVLTLSMTKEFVDDYKRYKKDKEANSAEYEVITMGGIR